MLTPGSPCSGVQGSLKTQKGHANLQQGSQPDNKHLFFLSSKLKLLLTFPALGSSPLVSFLSSILKSVISVANLDAAMGCNSLRYSSVCSM